MSRCFMQKGSVIPITSMCQQLSNTLVHILAPNLPWWARRTTTARQLQRYKPVLYSTVHVLYQLSTFCVFRFFVSIRKIFDYFPQNPLSFVEVQSIGSWTALAHLTDVQKMKYENKYLLQQIRSQSGCRQQARLKNASILNSFHPEQKIIAKLPVRPVCLFEAIRNFQNESKQVLKILTPFLWELADVNWNYAKRFHNFDF